MKQPRPTEAEFDELKRKRDAALAETVDAVCAEWGWDRSQVAVHVSHSSVCYCACPDGPCQHDWSGPNVPIGDGHGFSVTCSRCGASAISHDMRCAP